MESSLIILTHICEQLYVPDPTETATVSSTHLPLSRLLMDIIPPFAVYRLRSAKVLVYVEFLSALELLAVSICGKQFALDNLKSI